MVRDPRYVRWVMTAATHSVLSHLRVGADEYDAEIRRFVPFYEEMIGSLVEVLRDRVPAYGFVVDLGAGTGGLSSAILASIPSTRVRLIDIDESMLAVARSRLESHGSRAEFQPGAFSDPLPECDAVVASLSLHHVHSLHDKRGLYTRIRRALRPGGLFLSADATVHPAGPTRERNFTAWSEHLQQHGMTAAEASGHFAQWAEEDTYYPLRDELNALADAGFPAPECFWRRSPSTVFGGFVDG